MNVTENTVKNSKISLEIDHQCQHTEHTPQLGEISPKHQEVNKNKHMMPKMGKILPKETHQVRDLEAMEEGAVARTPTEGTRGYQTQPQHMSMNEYNAESNNSRQQESPGVTTAVTTREQCATIP